MSFWLCQVLQDNSQGAFATSSYGALADDSARQIERVQPWGKGEPRAALELSDFFGSSTQLHVEPPLWKDVRTYLTLLSNSARQASSRASAWVGDLQNLFMEPPCQYYMFRVIWGTLV